MLKVERIILKGFTGMGLHEIETFDFTLMSDVTIILGGNGCGKTSLLNVFFPIAPPKTDFVDGGVYTNIALCGDDRYEFKVKRDGNSLVCFIKNLSKDLVVLDHANAKVYNSRVYELTGIDKEVKELINGEALLTNGNTEQRRKWFTRMSTSDLSYALDFYKKLRKQASLMNGAIDHTAKKIADLQVRVLHDDEERKLLSARLVEMESELRQLDEAIAVLPNFDGSSNRDKIVAFLKSLESQVAKVLNERTLPTDLEISVAEQTLSVWKESAASADATTDAYSRELSILMDESTRQEYLMKNHTGLKETIGDLEQALANFTVEHWQWGELPLGDNITVQMLINAQNDLSQWTYSLSGSLDEINHPSRLREAEERLAGHDAISAGLREQLQRAENVLNGLEHDRTHFIDTQEVTCPRCTHVFRPGINDSLENIEAAIRREVEVCKGLRTKIETHQSTRGDIETDVVAKRRIRDIIMTYTKDPVVGLFFKRLIVEEVFTINRDRYAMMSVQFFEELKQAIEYRRVFEDLVKAKKDWDKAVNAVGNIDGALSAKIDRIRALLAESSQKRSDAQREVVKWREELHRLNDVRTTVEFLSRAFTVLDTMIETSTTNVMVTCLQTKRQSLLDTYAVARDRFRQMDSELQTLASLESEQKELQHRQKNIRLMITAWSPEKGVLKKYIYNSIVRITEMMNRYIGAVWQYPMNVLPCDVSEGDLDYTFPYTLKNNPDPVVDVVKGSKAQKNIFNLSYRLTAYKGLNLRQYPLLLDEPSEGMDEEHKQALVAFIKMLSESGEFSQVIVVSHEPEVHSKLNEATYCVVEPTGVTLPPVYNVGVKIKYAGQ